MSDPTRLFDGAGTDYERRMIGLARADAPPTGSLGRTLSVLGFAGGVLAPAVSHAAAIGEAAAGTEAATAGSSGASITFVAITKWLAIGIAGGALTATTAHFASIREPSSPPSAVLAPTSTGHKAPLKSAPENAPELPPPAASADGAHVEPAPPSEIGATLREELALLERARRSIAEGRSDEARNLLKRHRETFPSGALAEEAAVLRIEVLLARGEPVLAEQAGRDFLDAHPASPHAPRVRNLLFRAASDPKRSSRPSMD
jgi:hypothetical protein